MAHCQEFTEVKRFLEKNFSYELTIVWSCDETAYQAALQILRTGTVYI